MEALLENLPFLLNIIYVVAIAMTVLMIASCWRIFQKAGEPGWASIVPIYNGIVLAKICGKPTYWGFLILIPFLNIIFSIILTFALAKSFGKGAGFGFGLLFLPMIFYPVLAFGSSQFQGGKTMELEDHMVTTA